MPFTLSHPAAVMPLARRGLSLSSLVIGSMTPDFQYAINLTFVKLELKERFSHSLPGVFVFCLPVGLLVLLLFHGLLKFPLLSLFPVGQQQRLLPVARRFRCHSLRDFAAIALSLVVGSLTHIAWDSFTHTKGWVVRQWPLLSRSAIHTHGFNIKVCMLLQHGSSIFGIAVLLWAYWRWYQTAPVEPVDSRLQLAPALRWILLAVMGVSAGVLSLLFGFDHTPDVEGFFWYQRFLRYSIIGGMSATYLELVLFSIAWHLWRSSKSTRLR